MLPGTSIDVLQLKNASPLITFPANAPMVVCFVKSKNPCRKVRYSAWIGQGCSSLHSLNPKAHLVKNDKPSIDLITW